MTSEQSFRAVGEESHANPNCHSEPTGEESLSSLTRDFSLSLNMTNPISHSILNTESVNADLITSNLTVNIHIDFLSKQYIINLCKIY